MGRSLEGELGSTGPLHKACRVPDLLLHATRPPHRLNHVASRFERVTRLSASLHDPLKMEWQVRMPLTCNRIVRENKQAARLFV